MIDAKTSQLSSLQVLNEKWDRMGDSLLAQINIRRSINGPRVAIHLAPPPFPIGCRDFFIDDKRIGGNSGLSDSMTSPYLNSDEFKSTLCILHENGFTWDEINEFVWIARVDRHHLQLRQIELIYELTKNPDAAKVFYGLLYEGIDELGHEFIKTGIDISSIFLAGGSALLLDPVNFPLQVNPRARMANRMSKPKEKLSTEELAETLSDVDIIVFGYNENGIVLTSILDKFYGRIFTPLGFEPQKVIEEFPGRIGLDVILCERDNLADMVMSAKTSSDTLTPVVLSRYPNTRKPAQSRISPGLISEMIPLWWNPKKPDLKTSYYSALRKVSRTGSLNSILQSCSRASKARNILYADEQVQTALARRWEMMQQGEFMEDLFENIFKVPQKV